MRTNRDCIGARATVGFKFNTDEIKLVYYARIKPLPNTSVCISGELLDTAFEFDNSQQHYREGVNQVRNLKIRLTGSHWCSQNLEQHV